MAGRDRAVLDKKTASEEKGKKTPWALFIGTPARRHKLPDWLESLLIAMSWAAAPLSQGILLTARIKTWDVSFFLEALQGCLHLLQDVPMRVEVTTATTSVPGRSHGWVGQRHSGTSNSTWTSFGVWETFKSLRDWVCSVCILKYFNYFKNSTSSGSHMQCCFMPFLFGFIFILKSQWEKSPVRSCWSTLLGVKHREEAHSHDRDAAMTLLILGSRELETSKVKTLSEILGAPENKQWDTLKYHSP